MSSSRQCYLLTIDRKNLNSYKCHRKAKLNSKQTFQKNKLWVVLAALTVLMNLSLSYVKDINLSQILKNKQNLKVITRSSA